MLQRIGKVLVFFLLLSLAGTFAYVRWLQSEGEAMFAILRNLDPARVASILVERDGAVRSLREPAQLAAFCTAARDLQRWRPNHPSFASHTYVSIQLREGDLLQLDIGQLRYDATAYVYIVRRDAGTTRYLFRAMSGGLGGWLGNIAAGTGR